MGRSVQEDEIPLQPQVLIEPFEIWALDFIGLISLTSRKRRYVLVCIDYLTKWVEFKPLFLLLKNMLLISYLRTYLLALVSQERLL
jgi:hypothetical protein